MGFSGFMPFAAGRGNGPPSPYADKALFAGKLRERKVQKLTYSNMALGRTAQTAVVFLLFLTPVAYLRDKLPKHESVNTSISMDRFWQNKKFKVHQADMVLMGDSRTFIGLSPQKMEARLPEGIEIFNFGFESGGLNTFMFDRAIKKLDFSRPYPKVIVLGITPNTLTDRSVLNNHYNIIESKVLLYENYFEPISLPHLIQDFFDVQYPRYSKHFTEDGWCAMDLHPRDTSIWPKKFRSLFQKTQVDSMVVKTLYQQVRQWCSDGIWVFGFRPPTCMEMVQVENEFSGFNEERFIKQFTESGGIWYDPPRETEYITFDGSHLTKESAEKLSGYLADFIASRLSTTSSPQAANL